MFGEERFICPICKIGSGHRWFKIIRNNNVIRVAEVDNISISVHDNEGQFAMSLCQLCLGASIWLMGNLIYPKTDSLIDPPNEDMPDNIKTIYQEAREVFQISPRSSSALLRLSLEGILHDQDYNKGNLQDKILQLCRDKNNPKELILAAEVIRHYGNSSAHSGFINLNENLETAEELFMVLNIVADYIYTRPKKLDELLEKVPQSKRDKIETELQKHEK